MHEDIWAIILIIIDLLSYLNIFLIYWAELDKWKQRIVAEVGRGVQWCVRNKSTKTIIPQTSMQNYDNWKTPAISKNNLWDLVQKLWLGHEDGDVWNHNSSQLILPSKALRDAPWSIPKNLSHFRSGTNHKFDTGVNWMGWGADKRDPQNKELHIHFHQRAAGREYYGYSEYLNITMITLLNSAS